MICPNCKKVYSSRIKYCISCGTELIAEDKTNSAGGAPLPEKESIFAEKQDEERGGFVRRIDMTSQREKPDIAAVKKAPALKNTKGKIASGAVCAVMSAMLTAALALIFGTISGRELTDEKNIAGGMKSVDLLSVPVAEIALLPTDGYEIPPDATLEEAVTVMTSGSGVTGGNIRSIYESSTIGGALNAAASDYARYFRYGTVPERITAEKVKEVLSDNVSVINKNTGYTLSENDLSIAYDEIEKCAALFDSISVNALENRAGGYIRLARAYISLPALAAEITAAALFAALLLALGGKNGRLPLYIGVPLIITGLAAMIITFMFSMQIGIFGGLSGLEREMAKGAAAAASEGMYRVGGIYLFSGAAAIIAYALNRREKTVR